ncbi:MAG: ribosome assembly cofactor RimP [Bacteroidales bacterium]|nr:ribosome assembly cofactor RimP [Bacteroidales bacterium]
MRGPKVPSFIGNLLHDQARMILKDRIEKVISDHFSGSDKFLVDIKSKPGDKIAVFIDGDNGVTIDDCKAVTRLIESNFNRDNEDYDLTVSSSGADSPMKLPRQYFKHVGRTLEVTTKTGEVASGKLIAATGDSIELQHIPGKKETQKPNTVIKFSEIKEGKVILSFK